MTAIFLVYLNDLVVCITTQQSVGSLPGMKLKITLTALASSLVSVANGAAVNARAALDVFVPNIISPNVSTVWLVGSVETVTWLVDQTKIQSYSFVTSVSIYRYTGTPLMLL